jgi:hypothetical protein
MNSKTPLDAFIENLRTASHETQEQQCLGTHTSGGFSVPIADLKCEDHSISSWKTPHDCSLPLHTHTSGTFSCTDAEMECETKCEGSLTLPKTSIAPGCTITWQGADTKDRSGVVDFLHPDADGTLWAFCTRPDGGWAAVNTKYITNREDSHV